MPLDEMIFLKSKTSIIKSKELNNRIRIVQVKEYKTKGFKLLTESLVNFTTSEGSSHTGFELFERYSIIFMANGTFHLTQ